MTLEDMYKKLGGDYGDVRLRIPSEALIRATESEKAPHSDFLKRGRCPGGASQLFLASVDC